MKKHLCILLSVLMAICCIPALAGCGERRSEVLRVFVPGEYMDPDVYEQFSEWYFDQTGETVTVRETTFDSNEAMLLKIEKSKKDYDLVCPSDYMIQRMLRLDLLKPIDKSVIDVEAEQENGEPLIKDAYLSVTREFDAELTYTVPFMYGTFGIMYDYAKTKEHLDSWEYMFYQDDAAAGARYKRKLTQKESVREMYASACIYAEREALRALSHDYTEYGEDFTHKLQSIYETTSDDAIAEARRLLARQKKYLLKYEVDDGKFGIAAGTIDAVAGLYWSCDAGYVMGDYEDENGNVTPGNKNLWYVIPREGGNIYIDGFVIPKYARNEKAANLFLQYLCTEEVAVQNSVYIGAVSPVSSAYNSLYDEYSNDDEFYEGTEPGWREMYLDMFFPSPETRARCGIMKEFTENNSKINRMFADIVG